MTSTVLPPPRPAALPLTKGRVLAVLAMMTATVLGLLVVLGYEGVSAPLALHSPARTYAEQLTTIELPADYEVVQRDHGGSYVAAGNGPHASVSYRTARPVDVAAAQVQQALETAGYTVAAQAPNEDVTHLTGTAEGRDVEALIGVGRVDDLPYGYVDAVPGMTSVLLVVKDNGRHRT